MAIYKNKSGQKLAIYAHDIIADLPKTGDAANISAQISLDGAATAATNDTAPTELDATDAPGIYIFDLTQAETNADLIIVSPVSSTSSIAIEPVIIYTEPERREANATYWNGAAVATPDTAGYPKVTLKTGTGTGELSVTSGIASVNITQAGGSSIQQSGGYLRVRDASDAALATASALSSVSTAVGNIASGATVVRANDSSGNALAVASTALSTATWTSTRAGYIDKLNVSGTLAHSDAANTYKADVSGLATSAALATVDGIVDAILIDTAEIGAAGAGLTALGDTRIGDTTKIAGSTTAATRLARSARAIVLGVCDSGCTTTSIVTSSLDPAASAADQFKARIVIFDEATTTAALRGQATDITASSSGGVLTVTALTTAPASGDTFTIS